MIAERGNVFTFPGVNQAAREQLFASVKLEITLRIGRRERIAHCGGRRTVRGRDFSNGLAPFQIGPYNALSQGRRNRRDLLSAAPNTSRDLQLRSMSETPKVELKDPRIAALLAFLVPGLGHFYQGRTLKGVIYSVCILGTFFTGMVLGDWKVVYYNWGKRDRIIPPICQFWNGLPFLPALIQSRRVALSEHPHDRSYRARLESPLSAELLGELTDITSSVAINGGEVKGRLEIEPLDQGSLNGFTGQFQGRLMDKYPIQGKVKGIEIDPRVAPFPTRRIEFRLVGTIAFENSDLEIDGKVIGAVPRSIFNSYGAPLHDNKEINNPTDLEVTNGQLGRYFDLGTLFTMISGLLNVLAIYDAYEGPAYGYGEENEDDKSDKPDENKPDEKKTQAA